MSAAIAPIHTLALASHYDDAAFSCGGTLHRLASGGRRVLVVTVCAAPPGKSLSPYAAALHRRWGAEPGTEQATARAMVARRRAEDEAALAVLGAEGAYLDVPDCIYRATPDGDWLYQDDRALFGAVARDDAVTMGHVAASLRGWPGINRRTRILCPLAVGHHVDHQLVRQAAVQAFAGRQPPLRFYEDYPYAEDDEALAGVWAEEAGATDEASGSAWRPRVVRLGEEHLAAKLAAAARYRSQISTFWTDAAEQERALHDFALRRGRGRWPAERLWEPVRGAAKAG